MCVFQDSIEVWSKDLKKSEAIEGYKAVGIGIFGNKVVFKSPIQGQMWEARRLSSTRVDGAWPKKGIRPKNSVRNFVPGIHCMTSVRASKQYGRIVVRVKMWGTVKKYRKSGFGKGENGYLAQHVEIVSIVWQEPYGGFFESRMRRMFKRFPKSLKDERKRK